MARDEICHFFGIELHDRNGSLFENRKSAKSLYPTTQYTCPCDSNKPL